ncbi:hypothetical protein BJF80_01985 [Serinicoccus sp. CUA-874]|nr:hypothetical protein BJF80_01985 [Serinicoccus sp. CUA-874]
MATRVAPSRSARSSSGSQRDAVTSTRSSVATAAAAPIGVATREAEAVSKGTKGTPRSIEVVRASGAHRVSVQSTVASAASRYAVARANHPRRPVGPWATIPDARWGVGEPFATPGGRVGGEGRMTATPTKASSPSATLSQKISRHPATARTSAPSSGPTTEPISCTAPTTPSGIPRRPGGQRSATSARVAGTRPPPPRPWRKRPPTMTGSSTAAAVTAEPMTKTTRHHSRIRRRSTRSDTRPMSGRTAM